MTTKNPLIEKLMKYQKPETPFQAAMLGSICLNNGLQLVEEVMGLSQDLQNTQDLSLRKHLHAAISEREALLEQQLVSLEKYEELFSKLESSKD